MVFHCIHLYHHWSVLLKKINKNVILRAEGADYDALGNLLVRQTNVSKIQAMLSSIDEAYRQLGRAGAKKGDIPYNTAKDAKKAIRAGFIKNLLPDVGEAGFDIKTYKNLAKEFSKPNNDKRLKVIMGEDYGRVKQLFNLFAEASESPTGNLGTIFRVRGHRELHEQLDPAFFQIAEHCIRVGARVIQEWQDGCLYWDDVDYKEFYAKYGFQFFPLSP